MSEEGLIYLIQPGDLIGTQRYKIGMSHTPALTRTKKYGIKESRFLCDMTCKEPLVLERKIIKIFKQKFKLLSGREFFEGDENQILNTFVSIAMEHINSYYNYDSDFENKMDVDE